MATIYGIGVKWAIELTGLTGTGIASFKPTKVSKKRTAKKVEVMDGEGETAGVVYHDQKLEGTFTVTPSATTLALAKSYNVTPTPGTKFTAVDASDAEINGDWLVDDSSGEMGNDAPATISITATRYANADVHTVIS